MANGQDVQIHSPQKVRRTLEMCEESNFKNKTHCTHILDVRALGNEMKTLLRNKKS